MQDDHLNITSGSNYIQTSGLLAKGRQELLVSFDDSSLREAAVEFVNEVARYQAEQNRVVKAEETMTYGYWLVKFRQLREGLLDVYEYTQDAADFVRGASITLRYWIDQHEVCSRVQAPFSPPRADMLCVVSEGVTEGDDLEGVRYGIEGNMSGWWFLTRKYQGDGSPTKIEHLYHVSAKRADIRRYLALPSGYAFRSGDGSVWKESWSLRTLRQ